MYKKKVFNSIAKVHVVFSASRVGSSGYDHGELISVLDMIECSLKESRLVLIRVPALTACSVVVGQGGRGEFKTEATQCRNLLCKCDLVGH